MRISVFFKIILTVGTVLVLALTTLGANSGQMG